MTRYAIHPHPMSDAVLLKLWEEMPDILHFGAVLPTVQRISCFLNYMITMSEALIDHIIANRRRGKKHHIIINAEGVGHSTSMAKRIEAATGIETRATILGHLQRGGSPTAKDRVMASVMGAYAVDALMGGKSNRVVAYKDGKYVDYDIEEALAMQKELDPFQYSVAKILAR